MFIIRKVVIRFPHLTLSLFLVCGWLSHSAAQRISWQVSTELGYFRLEDSFVEANRDLLARLNATVSLKDRRSSPVWSLKANFKPEFYGIKKGIRNLKFIGKGSYFKPLQKWAWGMDFDLRHHRYNGSDLYLTVNIFQLRGMVSFQLTSPAYLWSALNIFYRDLFNDYDQSLDVIQWQGKYIRRFSRHWNLGGGVHLEKFRIHNTWTFPEFFQENSQTRSNGWRFGPILSWELRSKILLNFQYHFLIHESDILKKRALFQWIQVVAGKRFSRRYFLFLLVDYYFNDASIQNENKMGLAYIPVENESRIFAKLGCDLSNTSKIYFRIGLLRDDLIYRDYSLSGWQAVMGWEISQ
ncbi:MAG: hypothetical protein Kow0042_18190 [Calditrichia bacterium]